VDAVEVADGEVSLHGRVAEAHVLRAGVAAILVAAVGHLVVFQFVAVNLLAREAVDDGDIELDKKSYVVIGTLESYVQIRNYFGKDKVVPVMIDVDDGVRLERALKRERQQQSPKYDEMCRRFLADSADFSEEKVRSAGIEKVFVNDVLEDCISKVKEYVLSMEA
jgi:guanylate kinase